LNGAQVYAYAASLFDGPPQVGDVPPDGVQGDTITPGSTDVTVGLGLANPTTFAGGLGGNPGSTQGAGVLYLVTVTPA
jgi:hypothetical protein